MDKIVDKNIIKGIFLIILAEYGSFVAETVGCKTQKFIGENVLVKQFIILMIIYFSINFTSDNDVEPTINIIKAVLVWLGFVMFNKMNLEFTVVVFLLLIAVYIMDNYNQYYKTRKRNTDNLDKIQKNMYYLIIVLTIIGFLFYFSKQYRDYKDVWSSIDFIFGKNTCASISK